MSQPLQTLQESSRLDFLFEAGYTMLNECPTLSRFYMNEFQNSLTEFELSIPKQVQKQICKRCGQILISGLSQKVRLVKKTKIQTICLTCQDVKLYHGTVKNKKNIPKQNKQPIKEIQPLNNQTKTSLSHMNNQSKVLSNPHPHSSKAPSNHSPSKMNSQPKIQPNTITAPSAITKKQKNKGKKNNLKALLSKQNTNNNNQKSGGGNLDDFLSSL